MKKMVGNCLRRSQERKCNNRGASLVLVISVVAIVSILAVMLLSVSLLNYRMKYVNLHSQDNFYDAEAILDEIRTGLTEDIATAVETAYKTTLEQYGSLDETQRNALYVQTFVEEFKKLEIIDPECSDLDNPDSYNLGHLWELVDASQQDDVSLKTVGATEFATKSDFGTTTIDLADGTQVTRCVILDAAKKAKYAPKLIIDNTTGKITLKNLVVKYLDSKNYMTQIQTDIVLTCPSIDYLEQSANPTDLLSYSFVADQTTEAVGGIVAVHGSAYLGQNGTDFDNTVLDITPITDDGSTSAKLIAGGTLLARNNSKLTITNMTTWANNLNVNSATLTIEEKNSGEAKTYLEDDLTLESNYTAGPNVTLAGEFKAYGDGASAEKSSAILINGLNASLDMKNVTSLLIAGNSYVATKDIDEDLNSEEERNSNDNVLMGESVSLKSDQRAYLVPAEYIAPDCKSGGKNPMTESDYTALKSEIDALFGSGSSDIATTFLYDKDGKIPEALSRQGVVGATRQVYRVRVGSSIVSMVYFFLKFDSAADAVTYGLTNQEDEATLTARVLASNASINMPDSVQGSDYTSTDYSVYYNGSVLVSSESKASFIAGACTSLSTYTGLSSRLEQESDYYEDQFTALNHKLVEYTDPLTSEELGRSVYQNLVVDSMIFTDNNKTIAQNAKKVFLNQDSFGTTVKAVVINGNCTLSGNESVNNIKLDGEAIGEDIDYLRLVIASGDVKVAAGTSFKGLIISGGTVTFENGPVTTLTASPDEAKMAMAAKDMYENAGYDDKYMPADYMKNGSTYLDKEVTHSTTTDSVRYQDYVIYDNWKKS